MTGIIFWIPVILAGLFFFFRFRRKYQDRKKLKELKEFYNSQPDSPEKTLVLETIDRLLNR